MGALSLLGSPKKNFRKNNRKHIIYFRISLAKMREGARKFPYQKKTRIDWICWPKMSSFCIFWPKKCVFSWRGAGGGSYCLSWSELSSSEETQVLSGFFFAKRVGGSWFWIRTFNAAMNTSLASQYCGRPVGTHISILLRIFARKMFAEWEVAECRCYLASRFNRFKSADFIPQYDEGEFDIGFFLLDKQVKHLQILL